MRYFIYCRKSSESEDRQILSIDSQLSTLRATFGNRKDIQIADIYQEAFSAAAPGRPYFNEMLQRLTCREADGIIAWAPDRLARNSLDGGQIIYFLDRGIIKDLKFATYTFENNSQGKFMLQIMFGQSKYYSDALSENVKRGNRTKLELGWRPSQAPLGYLNDRMTKTVIADPARFPLVQQIFRLMLTGAYSPRQITEIARDCWGLRTVTKKRIGGKPPSLSAIYKILRSPFYAGLIKWNGQIYVGKHPAMITMDEFDRVAALIKRPSRPRPKTHSFAFTGMARCASCGGAITAERKTNRQGHRYTYYHCVKGPFKRCSEPYIEVKELEAQILSFLQTLVVQPDLHRWALSVLADDHKRTFAESESRNTSRERAIDELKRQSNELVALRLKHLLSDEEFTTAKEALLDEQRALSSQRITPESEAALIEPAEVLFSLGSRAVFWFKRGGDEEKRLILQTVGSNLTLGAKKLNIEAAKPLSLVREFGGFSQMRASVTNVGTGQRMRRRHKRTVARDLAKTVLDPKYRELFDRIKALNERLGPPPEASAPSSRQDKGASEDERSSSGLNF